MLKRQKWESRPRVFDIRLLILLPLFFLPPGLSEALGQTLFVQPSTEVPIRSGQGTDYKILAVVPDGLAVTVLEEAGSWVRVRTQGGTEGWMLKRYLSAEPPLSERMAALKTRNEQLEQEYDKVRLEMEELTTAYSQSQQELNACIAERDEVRSNYQGLRTDTADVIAIKQNLDETVRENQLIKQQLAEIEGENRKLAKNTSLKWFLAGGLVLITGWVLGLISGKSRRRKSTLY
jgi:SH3 domain protein